MNETNKANDIRALMLKKMILLIYYKYIYNIYTINE